MFLYRRSIRSAELIASKARIRRGKELALISTSSRFLSTPRKTENYGPSPRQAGLPASPLASVGRRGERLFDLLPRDAV